MPDNLLVRYLLGQFSEEERDRLEEQYFADDALHERLMALEDELIDSYVRGELSPVERQHFEERFLRSPERRRKLGFARTLLRYASSLPPKPAVTGAMRVPWWRSLLGFLRAPSPAPRLALVAVGVVLVFFPVVLVEYLRFPAPDAVRPPPGAVAPPAPRLMLSVILSPLERSAGEQNTVRIPLGVTQVRLRIDLEDKVSGFDASARYRATLETPEGRLLHQSEPVEVQAVAGDAHAFIVTSPADSLKPGDCVLRLYKIVAGGEDQLVGADSFRVRGEPSATIMLR